MAEALRVDTVSVHRAGVPTPGRRAFRLLHFAFTLVPFLAGIDKFTGVLARWQDYLSPHFARILPIAPATLMHLVGAVEITAGFLVALRPKIGGYVVAAWLVAIIVNLVLLGAHYDVALRDFGLVFASLALARLAQVYDLSPEVHE